jgi:lipopolysaccharide export system permease protein
MLKPRRWRKRVRLVNTLHRYLTRQVIGTLLMTVMVFTFVLLLGNLLKEILTLLVNRQATLGLVVESVGLLIPFVGVFALPMAMLTATLLVFGRFSADQELIAVRASGISLLSVITPVLLLSLFLCGVSAVVNMEIAPRCRVAYTDLLFNVRVELANAQLPEGRFITSFPGYMFYVEKNRKQNLQNVMVFQLEDGIVTTTLHAPRGQLHVDTTNRQVIIDLFNVKSVRLESGHSIPVSFSKFPIILDLNQKSKSPRKPRITDLTFTQLRNEMRELETHLTLPAPLPKLSSEELRGQKRELEKQRTDLTSPLRVQMHRQAAFSFACFGFTLLGIPLGIRVHRRETNVSFFIALALVLIYYGFTLLGQSLATRPEYAPHLILWLPNFIFQAVGAVLLWRANRGM